MCLSLAWRTAHCRDLAWTSKLHGIRGNNSTVAISLTAKKGDGVKMLGAENASDSAVLLSNVPEPCVVVA